MSDENNKYNSNVKYDEKGRKEHRRIFGKHPLPPGKYRMVDGKWIPLDQALKIKATKDSGPKVPLMKVRDQCMDVEVHRAAKNPKYTGMRIEKGYRRLGT
jgi:hypothetical protein